MQHIKKILMLVFLMLVFSINVIAFPYKMYSGMTGAKRLSAMLYIDAARIGSSNFTLSSPLYINFGFSRNFDVYARAVPITYMPELGFGVADMPQFSIMPRFQFINGFIGGIEFLIPGSTNQYFGINPQIHYLIGMGEFLTMFANLEVPMYFGDERGIVRYVRLKTALGVYPGSLFGFSLLGFLLEYHIAYDFYNSKILPLNHLGLAAYLVLNSDASLSLTISPYLEQIHSGFYFGVGAWISYSYDFSKNKR